MSPLDAMLVAVHCVSSWTTFVEFCVGITEHQTDVELWALFPDKQVLVTVLCHPASFSLDKEKAANFGQLEVWCIVSLSLRPNELDTLSLIQDL